ncbi:MAG: hypothetical protein PHD10_02055 [Bacilli bacterium]|nr:hypothetical protein [Bacilli bacterium]MDD4607907.1 hypothetical protein [Bacilli bacterium]
MGSHGNNTSYLNSGIVFMSGHGNSSLMSFMNNGTNKFYIDNTNVSGGSYIGIGNYVSSLNALIVFAGCETAKGSSNISSYVVNQGAKSSIGWTTSVNSGSHTNWLKRFNDKIKDKTTTVSAAKSSADGHIYLDSRVKNGKIYGYGNYNPWYFMNAGSYSSSQSEINKYRDIYSLSDNEYIISENGNRENLDELATKFINEKLDKDFDKKDYRLEINGNDTIYYDYVLYVNNIRTSLGYTVSLVDGNIIKVYDNMQCRNTKEIIEIINKTKINNDDIKKLSSKIESQVNEKYKEQKVKEYLLTPYYDLEKDTFSIVGLYDIEFTDRTFGSIIFTENI